MFETTAIACSLAALATLGPVSPAAPDPYALRPLEKLAGSWVLLDAEGEPSALAASYEVLAGGGAVLERLFAGTPEETATIYHLEDGKVTATQLSGRTSPVRLVPRTVEGKTTMRFVALDEGVSDDRLSTLELTPRSDDRLRIEWSHTIEGGEVTARVFDLRRESSLEDLAVKAERLRLDLASLRRELDARLKREIAVEEKGEPGRTLLETRTQPGGPGWTVAGVPLRQFLHDGTRKFSTTFAAKGDPGLTVAHYPFEAGRDCHLDFSVLGGHAYFCVVEEKRRPPRRISSIPDFSIELGSGEYGTVITTVAGGHWTDLPRSFHWDLSGYEGKTLRLYIVDAETNHFGQVAISEIRITEERGE